ncbi:LysR family transcriptional regulator [Lysinibacillus sp. FSL K6-0057]|uniref:LysR family transcriptional regulator n=1 Tax=unclassified Lysinibacillus TaxID=2636778 RepID=UPI003159454F
MQIQLKDLDIFVKVAEHNSFTKASEVLFIAQPSLSKSVQKLEKELNVTLFDRSNRKLRLTEVGMIVYEKSKAILSTLESISTSIADLSELVTGNLKVGVSHIVGTLFFPKVAQVYVNKFPGVTLEIFEEGGLVIEKHIERGLVDIGFVVLTKKNEHLKHTPIYNDEFVLCVSSKHPLSNLKIVSLVDLIDENFIFFSKKWALHELVVNACKDVGFIPKVAFESEQWDLIIELVSAQLGITLIPKILASKLNDVDIVSIPLTNPTIEWNIGVVTNGKSYQTFALKAFLKIVNQVYNDIDSSFED